MPTTALYQDLIENSRFNVPGLVRLGMACLAVLPVMVGCGTSTEPSDQDAAVSSTSAGQPPSAPIDSPMPVAPTVAPTVAPPSDTTTQEAMPTAQPVAPEASMPSIQPEPVPVPPTAAEPVATMPTPSVEPDGAGGMVQVIDEPVAPEPEVIDPIPEEPDVVAEPEPEATTLRDICPADVELAAPTFDVPFELLTGDPEDRSGLFEGVIWLAERGVLMHTELVFSGENPSRLFEYTPGGGSQELTRSGWLNGLALTANDDVVGASYSPPGIAGVQPEVQQLLASMTPTAMSFNSPNDLIVRSDSNLYFTDPTHQLGGRQSETGITGVYRVDPAGVVTLEEGELAEPNGLALSPDEQLLYVGYGPVGTGGVVVYDIGSDGALSNRRQFSSVGGTDGMTMDCAGNLYVVEHEEGLVHVIAPGGNVLGTIDTPPKTGNLAFGGPDRQTLYVTVSRALMSRPSALPGFPY